MSVNKARSCPLCGSPAGKTKFPFATAFNGEHFAYLGCTSCPTVFVNPIPSAATLASMYSKDAYHDRHYADATNSDSYTRSVELLSRFLAAGSKVLDYGCGSGAFLVACRKIGLQPYGVDFDACAAAAAAESAACEAVSLAAFEATSTELFDAVHFGDVLEHLPDPLGTVTQVSRRLRRGGLLFVEGPLEMNASLVYWCALTYGNIRQLLKLRGLASDPPTHLFRTDCRAQKMFFSKLTSEYKLVHWQVTETGWPYAAGGLVKKWIARLAVGLGGRRFGRFTFGNRFEAILERS